MHTHIQSQRYKHNSCQHENKMKQSDIKLTSRHRELGEKNYKPDSLMIQDTILKTETFSFPLESISQNALLNHKYSSRQILLQEGNTSLASHYGM